MNEPSPASRGVTPPGGRAVAHIDLGAIERNCAHIRSLLSDGVKLCAVVKADAYGHGDTWCAKAALAGGAEWLAVAAAGGGGVGRRGGGGGVAPSCNRRAAPRHGRSHGAGCAGRARVARRCRRLGAE